MHAHQHGTQVPRRLGNVGEDDLRLGRWERALGHIDGRRRGTHRGDGGREGGSVDGVSSAHAPGRDESVWLEEDEDAETGLEAQRE